MRVINAMKKVLFLLLLFKITAASAQDHGNVVRKRGIILFEGHEMYFVETSKTTFLSLLATRTDTLEAFMIHTDDGPLSFRKFLSHQMKFDSTLVRIRQENYQGQEYEDTSTVFGRYGWIEYVKSKGYNLKKRYKTVYFHDKTMVFVMERYLPVEMFTQKIQPKHKPKN